LEVQHGQGPVILVRVVEGEETVVLLVLFHVDYFLGGERFFIFVLPDVERRVDKDLARHFRLFVHGDTLR